MFVSLSILKLQEEGKVSLKDKVRDVVPEVWFENPWADQHPILIEHLLEHTTGWDDFHFCEYAHNQPDPIKLKDALAFHPHSRISRWVPGTRTSYCNSGPPVAAYIVEKITGKTFEDYVTENLFKPMGMNSSTYFESATYKVHKASLYMTDKPQPYWHILMRPSGSINASPNDLLQMVKFFANRGVIAGDTILSSASLDRMETPETSLAGRKGMVMGYGLNNYTSPFGKYLYRGHNGGMLGAVTDFGYLKDHNVGYVVAINSSNGQCLNEIVKHIRRFQTRGLSVEKPDLQVISPEDLEGLYMPVSPRNAKTYFLEKLSGALEIKIKNDTVIMKHLFGGGNKEFVYDGTHYRDLKLGEIGMVKGNDPLLGEVIQIGGLGWSTYQPTLGIVVWFRVIIAALWALCFIITIVLSIIWFIRLLRKKLPKDQRLIRFFPLIPYACLLIITAANATLDEQNVFEMIGTMNYFTLTLMVFTLLFAVSSLLALGYAIYQKGLNMSRWAYYYILGVCGLHFLVTIYLTWHGVIGIRLWA